MVEQKFVRWSSKNLHETAAQNIVRWSSKNLHGGRTKNCKMAEKEIVRWSSKNSNCQLTAFLQAVNSGLEQRLMLYEVQKYATPKKRRSKKRPANKNSRTWPPKKDVRGAAR
jgi:hypothetical protein